MKNMVISSVHIHLHSSGTFKLFDMGQFAKSEEQHAFVR